MEKIDKSLLLTVADLHSVPQGAYNIRKNGMLLERKCVPGIEIKTKKRKPGIDILVSPNVKNQSIHIPVIVTQDSVHDLVYNDFKIGKNAEVLIVAGCGLHNTGDKGSSHNGIHKFFLDEGASVRYVEKHFASGKKETKKDLNPTTIIHLAKGAKFVMETMQIGGVSFSNRETKAFLDKDATLEIKESILTEQKQIARTKFDVELNGRNSKVNVVSRSAVKNSSQQEFISNIFGNNACFGHVECDAIISENGKVSSTPALKNFHPDANLSHEAVIGKISGEQLIKLQTLGLSVKQAEDAILKGFLQN